MNFGRGSNASMLDKRIPTLVGLGILVVGLVVGIVLLGTGTSVFAPRATPETTPKQIRVTNVSDSSFTVSFATDEATPGFLKYGLEAQKTNTQAPDDRDKLTGSVESYTMHHITVTGLEAGTEYFYLLGTGGNTTFDNNGAPFSIKTTPRGGTPAAAKTAYGSVTTETGSPADGAIVYIKMEGVGELSTLVKSSGSWAIPLSNARATGTGAYAQVADEQSMTVEVRGVTPQQQVTYETLVSASRPVAALQFGKNTQSATLESSRSTDTDSETTAVRRGAINDLLGDDADLRDKETSESATLPVISEAAMATATASLDLTDTEHQLISTTQPVITGVVPPNVTIDIEVHSETQITQQLISNPDGTFTLDIEALGKELEPGEHTVTYSYIDPASGQKVTKTQTFTVAPKTDVQQLAQADTSDSRGRSTSTSPSPSPSPFGSGNPYPVGGTGTQSATQSATAGSATKSATKSATPSARTTMPSTASGIPVSGSVGTTTALVAGGLLFLLAGAWSFWMSKELEN